MKNFKIPLISLYLLLFLLSMPFQAKSQISVYPVQGFNFGTFYQRNAGGTITVLSDGSRQSTGDITLLSTGISFSEAIFDIEAPADAVVSITSSNATIVNGNGDVMTLEIIGSTPAAPFINKAVLPERTRIRFSGRLMVGDATVNRPGAYQGTFSVTFHHE